MSEPERFAGERVQARRRGRVGVAPEKWRNEFMHFCSIVFVDSLDDKLKTTGDITGSV
jgi:hypothetical protein